jgi:hypothetical protein
MNWLPRKEDTPTKDSIPEGLQLQRMQSRACLYYSIYIYIYSIILAFISSRHIDIYLRGEEDILHVHDSSRFGFVFGRLVQLLLRMLGTGKKGEKITFSESI